MGMLIGLLGHKPRTHVRNNHAKGALPPPGGKSRRFLALASALAMVAVTLTAPSSVAADPCAPGSNKIVCENSKPGTSPEVWDIQGAGDAGIQGFATDISVNIGSRVDFKINTSASAYTIDIYRTGWYQGLGARKVASVAPSAALPQNQPACRNDVATELVDCGNWAVSAGWKAPEDSRSVVSSVMSISLTRSCLASRSVTAPRPDGRWPPSSP